MRTMGLQAISPKPRTSAAANAHQIYPSLLSAVVVSRPSQVWSADITYVHMARGFMYLVAIIAWWSR
jgi:putative transposase